MVADAPPTITSPGLSASRYGVAPSKTSAPAEEDVRCCAVAASMTLASGERVGSTAEVAYTSVSPATARVNRWSLPDLVMTTARPFTSRMGSTPLPSAWTVRSMVCPR